MVFCLLRSQLGLFVEHSPPPPNSSSPPQHATRKAFVIPKNSRIYLHSPVLWASEPVVLLGDFWETSPTLFPGPHYQGTSEGRGVCYGIQALNTPSISSTYNTLPYVFNSHPPHVSPKGAPQNALSTAEDHRGWGGRQTARSR